MMSYQKQHKQRIFRVHDDVIKWHFPRYWPFVRGIHRSPMNSSHKGQWRGALMFSLICDRINIWINNREAGDLRRKRSHYDVIIMYTMATWHGNVFYMFVIQNNHVWFGIDGTHQLTYLCDVIAPYTDFEKSQATFQVIPVNTGLDVSSGNEALLANIYRMGVCQYGWQCKDLFK